MNRVGCGRNAVWGGCEECLINSHFQSPTRSFPTHLSANLVCSRIEINERFASMHMEGLPAWQYPLALPACAIERNLFPPRRISIFVHLHTFLSETMSKCQKYWKIGHNAKSIAGLVSTAQTRPDLGRDGRGGFSGSGLRASRVRSADSSRRATDGGLF